MKNIYVVFLFLSMSFTLNAQDIDNPKFQLQSTEVMHTLRLQTNPVYSSDVYVSIFTAGDKEVSTNRITQKITMHRGRSIHEIDVSKLPSGTYYVEIVEKAKRTFRKKIIKK